MLTISSCRSSIAQQVLPALLLRVQALEALERLHVVRVFVEHAPVLLDRLRLVADAILVGLGQLELGGEQLLRLVDRLHLALEHVDQVDPLGAIAVDALERLERVELRRHRLERLAVTA